jgi:hypothetical protein
LLTEPPSLYSFPVNDPGSYVAFACVKLVAYSLFAVALNRHLGGRQSALLVGVLRTLLGMAVGSAYFHLLSVTSDSDEFLGGKTPLMVFAYWMSFVPLRFAEWWLVLRVFYQPSRGGDPWAEELHGRTLISWPTRLKLIAAGTVVSYIADFPAAISAAIGSGSRIC